MSELPEPLTPADCDLRGLEYMPLLGQHLFGSEFNARASDGEWRAALTLWWAAWCQVPAASLPDDDIALCRFADLGRDVKIWKKLRENALHGWVKCSDGRIYHPVLAKQALIAWDKRKSDRQERTSSAERKAREREERSRIFRQLAEVGVTPDWNAKMCDLRALVTEHVTRDITQPVTTNVTAKTGRDGTGHKSSIPFSKENGAEAKIPEPAVEDPDKAFWAHASSYLGASKRSLIGRWVRDHGKDATAKAITEAQLQRVVDPPAYVERVLRGAGLRGNTTDQGSELPIC